MQEIISFIRQHSQTTQEQFAERTDIPLAVVQSWENGESEPELTEQTRLYDFCKANSVPIETYTQNRIQQISERITTKSGRSVLFHGSKNGLMGAIAPCSREFCDFGKGFYMGTSIEQGIMLTCSFENSVFYILSIDHTNLKSIEIPTGLDWALFVALHRGRMEEIRGTALYKRTAELGADCDIISGSIANDRMFYVLDHFFSGQITDRGLIQCLSVLQLGEQIVAVTEKACSQIRIEAEIRLSPLEKFRWQDIAENHRKQGIRMANQICKNYRREGLFFDEILSASEKESLC